MFASTANHNNCVHTSRKINFNFVVTKLVISPTQKAVKLTTKLMFSFIQQVLQGCNGFEESQLAHCPRPC